jgi:hypothetical protein
MARPISPRGIQAHSDRSMVRLEYLVSAAALGAAILLNFLR